MNDKVVCGRCGKESKHSYYCSEIDKKLICFDCWNKEQPKELMKRIAELEEENKRKKEDLDWYSLWHKNFIEQIDELTAELENYRPTKLAGDGQCSCYGCEQKEGFNRHWTTSCYQYKGHIYCSKCLKEIFDKEPNDELEKLQEENAKLKEQLKNVKLPKFKYHQIVYAVANADILKGQIDVFDFYQKKYLVHLYGIDDVNSLGDEWCCENEIFATEAEAKQSMKK